MVSECRARPPEIGQYVADARHLRHLADDGFDVVLLFYNGIDYDEPSGRLDALVAGFRIQPVGGVFVYSANVSLAPGGQLPDLYAQRPERTRNPVAMARRWSCCALRDARHKRNRQRLGASRLLAPHSALVNDSSDAHTFLPVHDSPEQEEASLAKARSADVGVLDASGNHVESRAAAPCLYDVGVASH
jgi:hypothetical protein